GRARVHRPQLHVGRLGPTVRRGREEGAGIVVVVTDAVHRARRLTGARRRRLRVISARPTSTTIGGETARTTSRADRGRAVRSSGPSRPARDRNNVVCP